MPEVRKHSIGAKWIRFLTCAGLGAICMACQSFGEFPAPGLDVNVDGLTATQGWAVYGDLAHHLQSEGFVEKQISPFICGTFKNPLYMKQPNENYKYFEQTEAGTPYVINVGVCIDRTHTSLMYQVAEIDPSTLSKVPAVFSPKACALIAGLRRYVSFLAEAAKIKYNHVYQCGTG